MFNEKRIVDRVIAGDQNAFSWLIQQYHALVFHTAYRVVASREDAEDICQEVFINVYKGLPGFGFRCKLSSWITRIASNAAISYLHKYKKCRAGEWPKDDEQEYGVDETPHDAMVKKQASGHLHGLIKQLPQTYKTVLTLYHLDEYSYLEIEAATGMPGGTVKGNLFRARKLLREKLEVQMGEEVISGHK
jgi:RNA polymerase sigma-70 factor (ECF subfamily)